MALVMVRVMVHVMLIIMAVMLTNYDHNHACAHHVSPAGRPIGVLLCLRRAHRTARERHHQRCVLGAEVRYQQPL